MSTFDCICNDLRRLGVKPGMVLMVHSSYKSLGISDGVQTVIDALQKVLTPDGTLLMPALTYSMVTKEHPYFSYHDTPVCVGVIPEVFRKSDGVIRSFNPVHSVCAWGKLAVELTENHHLDNISIGENSPYRMLPRYSGKILMLGCGLRPNTFMHGVENIAGLPYRKILETIEYTMIDRDGVSSTYYGGVGSMSRYEQRYDRITNILHAPDIITGDVANATANLIDAKALETAALNILKTKPFYFVDPLDETK